MAKKASGFLAQQKIAVGVIAVIVVGILGYLSTLVVKDAPLLGEYIEGEHYTLLENPRRVRGKKVEVMEFFSYACIHCYNFDPELTAWAEDNIDKINFVRTAAISSEYWRLLGQHFYAMEKLGITEQNHMAFFREVHDVKRNFSSLNRLADYIDGKGATAEEYRRAFNSPEVTRKMAGADQMARRLMVASVPTIIVHGKYMVRTTRSVGISRMLDVMDFLVEKEMSAMNPESDQQTK